MLEPYYVLDARRQHLSVKMFYSKVVERNKLIQIRLVLKLHCGYAAVVRVRNDTDVNPEVVFEHNFLEDSLVLLNFSDKVLVHLELELLVLLIAIASVDLGQIHEARVHWNHVQLRFTAGVLLDEASKRERIVAVCGEHGKLVRGYLECILWRRDLRVLRNDVVVQVPIVLEVDQAFDVVKHRFVWLVVVLQVSELEK